MGAATLKDLEPEDLVHLIRGKRPIDERIAALRVLEGKYQPLLSGRIGNGVRDIPQFLAASKSGSIEHFAADVLGKAIRTWKSGRGASFSTWIYEILTNAITDGLRATKNLPLPSIDRDGRDRLSGLPAASSPSVSPLEYLGLLDALRLARECLGAMQERWRKVFVWGILLRMSNEEIREVWPAESLDNVKQMKCRAAARFSVLWLEKGGGRTEELLQSLAGAVADKVDPRKIKDERAREAYRVWMREGSLSGAARAMKMDSEHLRKTLLEAMHDLFDQGMYRGEQLDPASVRSRERDLARYFELVDGEAPKDATLARLVHSLDVVRAAFGFAPAVAATHTLGSFIQSRLTREEDYSEACRTLGLKATALRKLLADEFEAEEDFFVRLARFLEVPAERLRALPRRPAGGTRMRLRSRSQFDQEAFHERVLAWIGK